MLIASAFLVAFAVQILAISVLYTAWYARYVRTWATSVPAEGFARFAQLYPGVDLGLALERFLTRFRALNTGIALVGVLLLGWLFSYMRRPDWDDDLVLVLHAVYSMLQWVPFIVLAWISFRSKSKLLKHSLPERKRTASLQRRGLFDFVSPFVVFLAVLGYVLFVAFVVFMIRIEQPPFQGIKGYLVIGVFTLTYAGCALSVYSMLYGKKINPFETHAGHVQMIGLGAKVTVYSCIAFSVYLPLFFTLELLDLDRWMPFAQSVFFVIVMLICCMALTALPRQPEAGGLGSSPAS